MSRIVAGRYAEIADTRRVGGQSEVFAAVDLHQGGRKVAVKIVPAKSDDIYRIYFERETAALRRLSHPNIASLLDSGTDDHLGVYYVVLDWIPQTVTHWVAGLGGLPGWDDVAEVVALPLASALAHSHSLSVLHRDIKPANVLWSGEKPLLADFALSKIKNQIAGVRDATVVGMATAPWAPPDRSSRGSTRFDVYGLAATLLQCVTERELLDYPDIPRALDDADVPRDVAALLRRALDPDPALRPADGQVFHLELQEIQTARSSRWHKRREVAFELSRTARRALEESGHGRAAEDIIAQRMGSATYAVPRRKSLPDGRATLTAAEFQLIGDQVQLVLVFATPYKLVCKWAEVKDFEELDRWRRHDAAVTLDGRDFVWTARPAANQKHSALATNEIHNLLEKAVQDSGDRFSDRFKQARLDSWGQLIDAKEQLEKRLEEPIPYTRIGRAGREFTLRTTTPPSAAILGQDRLARPRDETNSRAVGVTIVDLDGTDLTVRAALPTADLGFDGFLVRDRTPSRAAIRRQKDALSALREGSATRPHLRELVLDPSLTVAPEPVAFQAFTPDLDDDKMVAVAKALGSGDLFLVEGPPGTGKTSFICELVHQYLAARPGDRVLLVSQMHVAIDNAVTRLHRSGVESVVRLSSRDDNVDPAAGHLLLSNKLKAWAAEIAVRARDGMAVLAEREGVLIEHLAFALHAEAALATLRQQSDSAAALGPLTTEDRLDNEELPEDRAELLADYLRSTDRARDAVAAVRDAAGELNLVVPESFDGSELETFVDGVLGGGHTDRLRELVRAQGDWLSSLNDPRTAEPMFLPTQSVVAGTCMGFLANSHIQAMQFDLCIIDEASRATAPELLVPMTRSKRWVMVGDTKQLPPMVEEVFDHRDIIQTYNLDKGFLSASLFDTLLGEVPAECKTTLITQHRMAVPIGELVSDIFYDRTLVHDPVAVLDPDTVAAQDRVVWYSTSRRGDRHEDTRFPGSTSSFNTLEARQVAELAARLDARVRAGEFRRLDGGTVEVLVLSGYAQQCIEIERALRGLHLDHLAVQIKTVDAVQGRESDVVIFSVTRSNLAGELGFLAEQFQGRLNVALSRAREVLWILGDSEFCAAAAGPLKKALHHIVSSGAGRVEYL